MSAALPVLYSFRRCPYAMRARLALAASETVVEHREVLLRGKPAEMLAASPKGTVPVLVLPDGQVVEESLDIMRWALGRHDPRGWLTAGDAMFDLVAINDGPFKQALDRYKYPNRYDGEDALENRARGLEILTALEARLAGSAFLCGEAMSLADAAIFPFVRQFAHTDREWFARQALPHLQAWLAAHLASPLFTGVMQKYPVWTANRETDGAALRVAPS
ncbi:glutathione S-transferase [Maricaulis salignorans]|uniref:Glutathione S-transferase n=1 Tax=Maricaulis salignorans TaxID=144026 RepID=A0A1G9TJ77_9PROT|nr:glutathione S-transferase [Maricaulis salignorans]SDM47761.1 Glutathione S-transferase [Maricaulis salignorans]